MHVNSDVGWKNVNLIFFFLIFRGNSSQLVRDKRLLIYFFLYGTLLASSCSLLLLFNSSCFLLLPLASSFFFLLPFAYSSFLLLHLTSSYIYFLPLTSSRFLVLFPQCVTFHLSLVPFFSWYFHFSCFLLSSSSCLSCS